MAAMLTGYGENARFYSTGLDLRAFVPELKSKRRQTQNIAVKNVAVAYVLWLLGGFGVLGLHRFYLGRWVTGLLWLLTGGLFLIGAIIDLFLIPTMVQVENLTIQLLAHANRDRSLAGHLPQTAA